jgi:putative peptidoglycan lipid II flippase
MKAKAPGAASRKILRSTALLTGLAAVSGLLGFGRDAAIAAVFGADSAVDAFLVAQGLMNLVLALLAGAIAKALVPTVSRAVASDKPQQSHLVINTVLTGTAAVLVPAAVAMAWGAESIVGLLAPGFPPGVAAEAARLTRIVLLATVLVAGTDILAAACQAHGRFLYSGLQGIPFNLTMIGFTVALGSRWGADALAIGFVVGSGLRLLIQVPAVRAAGVLLRPRLRTRDRGVREVIRLLPALLVGTALVNVNNLVDRAVGSGEAEGTIAALSFAWRLVTLPHTLLIISLVAALYPAMSALSAPDNRTALRQVTGRSMGMVIFLLAPVVAFLLAAAEPIVRVVFGRGAFDERAVQMTSTAVAWFAAALMGVAMVEVSSRSFYSLGDSRTPVALAVVGMAVNVVGDMTVGRAFGVAGIAAATTASFVVVAIGQSLALHIRYRALDGTLLVGRIARCATAAAAAGIVAWGLLAVLPTATNDAAGQIVVLLVSVAGSAAAYLGILALLRGPELNDGRVVIASLTNRGNRSDAPSG